MADGRFLAVALAWGACAAACGGPAHTAALAADVTVEWTLHASPPLVGRASLAEMRLKDAAGRPMRGAALRVEGHMSHPGMAPVIVDAVERGEGVYEARVPFTMAGDWIVVASGTLPDGRRVERVVAPHLVVSSPGP